MPVLLNRNSGPILRSLVPQPRLGLGPHHTFTRCTYCNVNVTAHLHFLVSQLHAIKPGLWDNHGFLDNLALRTTRKISGYARPLINRIRSRVRKVRVPTPRFR